MEEVFHNIRRLGRIARQRRESPIETLQIFLEKMSIEKHADVIIDKIKTSQPLNEEDKEFVIHHMKDHLCGGSDWR